MSRYTRLSLALLMCIAITGCASPASASPKVSVDLDNRAGHVTSLAGVDSMLATHGNLYSIDAIDAGSPLTTTAPHVAILMINPRTNELILNALRPGTADVYWRSEGKLMRLQVMVR